MEQSNHNSLTGWSTLHEIRVLWVQVTLGAFDFFLAFVLIYNLAYIASRECKSGLEIKKIIKSPFGD